MVEFGNKSEIILHLVKRDRKIRSLELLYLYFSIILSFF